MPDAPLSPTTKFALGRLVATPSALDAMKRGNVHASQFVARHAVGDWGDVCKSDRKLNDEAVAHEGYADRQQRVLSVYHTSDGTKLYLITECDRSVTTLLLADEY